MKSFSMIVIVGCVLSGYRLDSLTRLLDNGLSVNYTGQFSVIPHVELMLRFLCELVDRTRSVPLARLLIQRGTNIEEADRWGTVIYSAIYYNNYEIATLLLSHGADSNAVNHGGDTPLHFASKWGGNNAEMIHLLIAHGADIEARDRDGGTPLILSSLNSLSMAALLEHGADAGVHNIYGLTPLHGACGWLDSQHQELAQSLLENGADVNAISNSGLNPLHYAVFHQSGAALVALLLEHGANVNATDGTGDTPLQLLARYGAHDTTDTITLLLDYGADVSVLDIGERCRLPGLMNVAAGE